MTMHDTERAFIAGCLARPGDAAPWLVFADWLEERGDRRHAYVRRYLPHLQRLTREAVPGERTCRGVSVPGFMLWLADWRDGGFRFLPMTDPPPLTLARLAPAGA
jgi:uncharacterized protein (TIGR02996 family)